MEHILLHVDSSKHANLDSFPFRYGFTFKTSDRIKLSPLSGERFHKKKDAKYRDRYHVDAKFTNPESGKIESGHFVIVEDNNARIDRIATVWRASGNVRTETHLSEVIRQLRENGFITVEDILKMHSLYVSGSLKTHADLVKHLAKELTSDKILKLNKVAKSADDRAELLLSELDLAKENLKQARQDNQKISDKNNELSESLEFEAYAREEAEENASRESESRVEAEVRADSESKRADQEKHEKELIKKEFSDFRAKFNFYAPVAHISNIEQAEPLSKIGNEWNSGIYKVINVDWGVAGKNSQKAVKVDLQDENGYFSTVYNNWSRGLYERYEMTKMLENQFVRYSTWGNYDKNRWFKNIEPINGQVLLEGEYVTILEGLESNE
jgi:hypothetical protein